MGTLIIVLTYIAYVLIVAIYTVKVRGWLKMPPHIRWDLYPVIHEKNYRYGGSYYEQEEWWTKPPSPRPLAEPALFVERQFLHGRVLQKESALLVVSSAVASEFHFHHRFPYPLFFCRLCYGRRVGDRASSHTWREGRFTTFCWRPEAFPLLPAPSAASA